MNHNLKCIEPYFTKVAEGVKCFEVRKFDRDFKVGDTLTLQRYDNGEFTGVEVRVVVDYILYGGEFGIDKDYCVMSIRIITNE